jgi:hypothetical protein
MSGAVAMIFLLPMARVWKCVQSVQLLISKRRYYSWYLLLFIFWLDMDIADTVVFNIKLDSFLSRWYQRLKLEGML